MSLGVRTTPRYLYSGVRRRISPVGSGRQGSWPNMTPRTSLARAPRICSIASVLPGPRLTRKRKCRRVDRATTATRGKHCWSAVGDSKSDIIAKSSAHPKGRTSSRRPTSDPEQWCAHPSSLQTRRICRRPIAKRAPNIQLDRHLAWSLWWQGRCSCCH